MPNGRFSHLYHGGDIRPLRAEYSEPSKGRGEEVASHLNAPRAAISAQVPGPTPSAGVSPSVRDGPGFAVFLGRVCDAGTEEARREAH